MNLMEIIMFMLNYSEHLMMDQAKEMVKQGFLDAGYEYIIVDDCWLDHKRDPVTGKLQPDSARFPSGMKALGEYVSNENYLDYCFR